MHWPFLGWLCKALPSTGPSAPLRPTRTHATRSTQHTVRAAAPRSLFGAAEKESTRSLV